MGMRVGRSGTGRFGKSGGKGMRTAHDYMHYIALVHLLSGCYLIREEVISSLKLIELSVEWRLPSRCRSFSLLRIFESCRKLKGRRRVDSIGENLWTAKVGRSNRKGQWQVGAREKKKKSFSIHRRDRLVRKRYCCWYFFFDDGLFVCGSEHRKCTWRVFFYLFFFLASFFNLKAG